MLKSLTQSSRVSRHWTHFLWCVFLPGQILGGPLIAYAQIPADSRSLLIKHCGDCHQSQTPAGGLDIHKLAPDLADAKQLAVWIRVHDRIAKREMPPRDAEPLPDPERQKILSTLAPALETVSLARQAREGRVLVRRLNRSEYQHSLHDLLGVTTDVRSLLPEDNIVGGFDKASGGLEISATHLVRFQQSLDKALADALPPEIVLEKPWQARWTGREFLDSRPKPNREGTEPFVQFVGDSIVLCARLYKHGSVATRPTPVRGRYRVRASVGAIRNADKPLPVLLGRMSSDRFAHERLEHLIDIQDAPSMGRRIIEVEAILGEGEQVYLEGLGLIFFGELSRQRDKRPVGDDYDGPGLVVDWIEIEGPLEAGYAYREMFGGLPRVPNRFYEDAVAGKPVKEDWSKWHPNEFLKPHNRLRLVSQDLRGDAERLIRVFVPRAFRGTAPAEVVDGYVRAAMKRLDDGEPLEESLTKTYKEILSSPRFWMLMEKPGPLDDFAIASRLSYFLWDSTPDDQLLAAAARGDLTRAGSKVLREQTERLLLDPKSRRFTESFTGQWLDLRRIHEMKPDAMYVEYDELLAWSMPEETRRFFQEMLDHDLPVASLLDSNWTMLNERLAKHYGIPGVHGLDFRRTHLPPESHRGGVITQASFLKLSTNATYTSPVKRGVWVLERILGTPPSPPPPNVAAIEPDIRGATTIREQLAKHQATAACAACHSQIDPPGFALENFDVLGGWRDRYRAKQGGEGNQYVELAHYPGRKVWLARPVEAAGKLETGESFVDIDEYRRLVLRDRDQLARNVIEKLLIYGTGAPVQFADRSEVERMVAQSRKADQGLRTLIHEVVQSRMFRNK
jgi:hypothetical protein